MSTNPQILIGDCRTILKEMPDDSIDCCVTSPPYYGLRDYGHGGQIGREPSLQEFIEVLVSVFSEVKRVLKPTGTCWVNMGDSYASAGGKRDPSIRANGTLSFRAGSDAGKEHGLPPKSLLGVPWRLAFALQDDGWILRQDIIWAKPNPMPESVRDRCTKSHEYIFLLTKSAKYHFEAAEIREAPSAALLKQIAEGYNGHSTKAFASGGAQDASKTKHSIIDRKRAKLPQGWATGPGAHGTIHPDGREKPRARGHEKAHVGFNSKWDQMTKAEQQALGSNKRSVWTVATHPCKEAHFATFPEDLIKPCILAGSPPGGTVLDPFGGSGTTGKVAIDYGRKAILIELNPGYAKLAQSRLAAATPGFAF